MSNNFWKVITLMFIIFLVVAILTHAYGFSLAAGTIYGGTNALGKTLEGQGISSGGTKTAKG